MSVALRLRIRIANVLTRLGFPSDWFLTPLAAIVGTLAGLVAVGFQRMVNFSSQTLFGRYFELDFYGSRYALLILLPALGGLLVGLIGLASGKAGSGHGIPDVVEALARRRGRLPTRSGVFKAITSSLTIGSGGSAGVEGPIIQIGAVLGSAIGQVLSVGREHMHTLVGCGAAGGLAGIFNAPIAGVLFVLEVVLRDFSLKTFVPIVIASVFGTATARAMLGDQAVFRVHDSLRSWELSLNELGFFALLGVMCGLVGVTFTRAMIVAERLWGRSRIPRWIRPAVGGMALGALGLLFVTLFRHPVPGYDPPSFYSNGYPVIKWLFVPASYLPHAVVDPEGAGTMVQATVLLLLAMMAFKIVGTCLTLGSGGSGGILAPSLFMGAALGGAFGAALQSTGWFASIQPATYALAGMAGVLAAAVHCPLTAFLLVFELTQDYKVILPVMLVSILATLFAQILYRDTTYTYWLRHMGIRMGSYSDTAVLRRLDVAQVVLTAAALVHANEPAQRLIDLAADFAVNDYVVIDDEDGYVGMVVGEDVRTTLLQREAVPLLIVGELMRTDLPTIRREQTLDVVFDLFARYDVASLTVVDDDSRVLGMITRSRLLKRYQTALED